ncbi:MAG: small ribosomal subunit Rsm22 family protein [Verrucomicrobia bacterium]|nr:small ribosomal subunit Rsm22 family protein [Verrucomicrobiota bacterium]
MSDWEHLDWQALAGLRERFLSGRADGVDYWQSDALISAYDATFAQRIGWKWDAVLAETKARDWQPPHATLVIDWGCGSGIASRALVEAFPELASAEFLFFDQSRIASTYAANRMAQRFPQSSATATTTLPDAHTCNKAVVLLSHVINELNLQQQTMLAETLLQAQTVIWVEPGARAESERLLVVREQLRTAFHLWAPCPHQHLCPLLKTPGSDWCHHFAHPPPEVFTDPNWAKFGKWMGVDLRSLPFSYLVCDKDLKRVTRRKMQPGFWDAPENIMAT